MNGTFLARPKGFEPPVFRIGICCVIQLRHGRIYYAVVKPHIFYLNIKSEQDNISVLHDILFALGADKSLFLSRVHRAASHKVVK